MREGGLREIFMSGWSLSTDEPVEILRSCINCTGSASLTATFVVILIGFVLAGHFERRKIALSRSRR
jgi:hypothetical protein